MSFLYPRTVSITRPAPPTDIGQAPYQGERTTAEDDVVADLPASIQMKSTGGGAPDTKLPGDTSRKSYWKIFIPATALDLGKVKTHDIVTDDLGVRYQVSAPYWNSLGYAMLCERLEA